MMLRFAILLTLLAVSAGYRQFQDRIPNGDHVPHPCKPNFVWRGVGHLNPLGGGHRNPFGLDFAKHDKTWTRELCMTDSDGDGLTNGQELGDPECTWKPDTFPKRVTGITHPGVCDPWGSDKCKQKNADIKCDTGEYNCPAVRESHVSKEKHTWKDRDPAGNSGKDDLFKPFQSWKGDVRNFTIRFPKTLVPAEETSYMCMSFDFKFPDDDAPDQEYHIIGTQPVIDNANVMHHIVLTGCEATAKGISKPTLCYMSQDGCFNPIGLWTLGMPGECVYKEAGFKIGGGRSTKIMMQFHWTNPERVPDYYDESGMIIYYTPILRKYNAGMFITGEQKLMIPPGKKRVTHTSTCSSDCTRQIISGEIFITTGLNHMHYLGFQQNVELYRNDKKIADLAKDDIYSYDNPVVHVMEPPQPILPGDRLETTCVYRSLSRTTTSYFGEGTYDEMCYGIFTVFPAENVTSTCTTWGNIEQCGTKSLESGNCKLMKFHNTSDPETIALRRLVTDNCNFYGSCREECPAALAKAREHPCLQGEYGEYLLWGMSLTHLEADIKFLAALSSCDCPADKIPAARAVGIEISEKSFGHRNIPCILIVLISLTLHLLSLN